MQTSAEARAAGKSPRPTRHGFRPHLLRFQLHLFMEIVLYLFAALAVGATLGWWLGRSRQQSLHAQTEARHAAERATLTAERDHLAAQVEQQRTAAAAAAHNAERQLAQEQERTRQLLAQSEERAREMRAADEARWQEQWRTQSEALQKATLQQLQAQQADLQTANRTQMDTLLRPIKEQFADFRRTVEESGKLSAASRQQMASTFESTLQLFQQQQQQAVAQLREQTERIGTDAAQLTQALKGDSKVQGDWGEMVLATMLENCGLRRGEEYFVQENVKDEAGRDLRPDVVVRFPEGRSIVIDSKVSITAYTAAMAMPENQEAERTRLLKEHVASVRRHVDELAAKDYSRLVDGAIGFVLMFVPNESSYVAAMQADATLSQYAYQRHVVIISPSNLLMALKLAYNLWQYDRQTRNVEQIVQRAGLLYDKVATFADTFDEVEKKIHGLSEAFTKARSQLYNGRGNVMSQVEKLREMGITPKKRLAKTEE